MPVTKGREGVKQEMRKFKKGQLHSGSAKGPVVKDRAQAIAISLNEAGLSKKKAGKKKTPPKPKQSPAAAREFRLRNVKI